MTTLPMELVNKVLTYRPRNPVAEIVKQIVDNDINKRMNPNDLHPDIRRLKEIFYRKLRHITHKEVSYVEDSNWKLVREIYGLFIYYNDGIEIRNIQEIKKERIVDSKKWFLENPGSWINVSNDKDASDISDYDEDSDYEEDN